MLFFFFRFAKKFFGVYYIIRKSILQGMIIFLFLILG